MKRRFLGLFGGLWLILAAAAATASPQNETGPMVSADPGPSWSYSFVDGMEAYERGDYRAALRIWRLLAEQGDAAAQYQIGTMYQEGRGVLPSRVEAERWYRFAARNGDLELRLRAGQRLVDYVMQSVPAAENARLALVIGNSAYENLAPLASAAGDAADIADMLRQLGFEVTLATDQDHRSALDTMIDFAMRSEGADMAAVFFAGHGLAVDGQNYLIPVDAALDDDRHVSQQTLPLNYMLRAVENAASLGLVILDAAHANPFRNASGAAGSLANLGHGMAPVAPVSPSVVVAYSAEAGAVAADSEGSNSAYTAALLAHLDDPGIGLGQIFARVRDAVLKATQRRQRPFTSGASASDDLVLTTQGQARR